MSIVMDILGSYRRPRAMFRRRVGGEIREDRAIAVLMGACVIVFVAQWPRLSREAFQQGEDVQMLIGATLLAWVFIMPLILYAIGSLSHMVARLFGGRGNAYRARFALFWALLCAAPLWLLNGLVAGFIGPGPALQVTGIIALAGFLAFWSINWREAEYP
ncbi:YIP1 family protein [Aliiroseovarius sp.]|uniref:YIP1 family protein n=1 Tax=Aliiroseovarius sp. TaxID=1872442 RepID=UPI00262F5DE4|nr:YIP1 family protein [Aliiroseovarius sp.]